VRLLLDTNALLWALASPARLGAARSAIEHPANDVFVSAVCAWEIAITLGLGKLAAPPNAAAWLPAQLAAKRFTPLPITLEHALAVEQLPPRHRDPFDRMLVAQASVEGLTIVSGDPQLGSYPVPLILC
jgi:PIN domain nuclease of toxin-antitoxin system